MDWILNDEINKTDSKDSDTTDWKKITLAIPENFYPVYKKTLEAYKILNETDKTFPAFQAMVLEAYNSLPEDIRKMLNLEEIP